jgi:hypothetical protein
MLAEISCQAIENASGAPFSWDGTQVPFPNFEISILDRNSTQQIHAFQENR